MILLLAAVLATPASSLAEGWTRTKESWPGCEKYGDLIDLIRYAAEGDEMSVSKLMESGACRQIPARTRIYVEDSTDKGFVRVHETETSIPLWTLEDALQRKR